MMKAPNDYLLLTIALQRMEKYDASSLISEEEMDQRLGISSEELDAADDVEFE